MENNHQLKLYCLNLSLNFKLYLIYCFYWQHSQILFRGMFSKNKYVLYMFKIFITHSKCISLELDMLNLSKTLDNLDSKISHFLNNPDCTLRDPFLLWIDDYNRSFCQLISYVNDEEVRAEPVARKVILKGGPGFLKVNIDNDKLKDYLFWGDADIEEMHYLIGATKVLWFEMKNVASPYGERHIRNINIPQELYELDKRGRLNEDIHFTKVDDIKDPMNVNSVNNSLVC